MTTSRAATSEPGLAARARQREEMIRQPPLGGCVPQAGRPSSEVTGAACTHRPRGATTDVNSPLAAVVPSRGVRRDAELVRACMCQGAAGWITDPGGVVGLFAARQLDELLGEGDRSGRAPPHASAGELGQLVLGKIGL